MSLNQGIRKVTLVRAGFRGGGGGPPCLVGLGAAGRRGCFPLGRGGAGFFPGGRRGGRGPRKLVCRFGAVFGLKAFVIPFPGRRCRSAHPTSAARVSRR